LQGSDLPKEKQDAPPFRAFPGDVRLNEKCISYERTKSAQGRDESELADLFAEIQTEIDRAQVQVSMRRGERVLGGQSRSAEKRQAEKESERPHHSSLR